MLVNDPEARRLYLGERFYMNLDTHQRRATAGKTPANPEPPEPGHS
jgi:hypothetical protein